MGGTVRPGPYYVFNRLIKPPTRGAPIDPETTNRVLPPILVLCSLRRTFANINSKDLRIGWDIPHATWVHCELEMRQSQLEQYEKIYGRAAPELSRGYYEKTESGLRDLVVHRRLCYATTATDLDRF